MSLKQLALERCDCDCHRKCGIRHIQSCCTACPICERNIKPAFFVRHLTRCLRKEEQALLAYIKPRLRRAWCAETAAPSVRNRWSPANPALGQCAVTALLIQALLDGDLMRTVVDGNSHYYNRLPSGDRVDLTAEQFPPGTKIPAGRPRQPDRALLSKKARLAETQQRLELLARRYFSFKPTDVEE